MGRVAKSDEEKAAKGTLDKRYSQEARASEALSKVLAFPAFREIPATRIPLGPEGQRVYDSWSRRLFDVGLLTEVSKGFVENLAMCEDKIHFAHGAGKMVSDKTLELRRTALLRLEGLNADINLAPTRNSQNPFAHCGFARRLREAEA